jgi:hypothetical protein
VPRGQSLQRVLHKRDTESAPHNNQSKNLPPNKSERETRETPNPPARN